MITMFVDHATVVKEYPQELDRFINTLKVSGSVYKDTPIEKMNFAYNFSFFLKKGTYTKEYVDDIVKMSFQERYEHELSKVRASLVLSVGHFYICDRITGVSDTIKEAVKYTTAQKMQDEAIVLEDDSLLDTIPEIKIFNENQEPREITLEQQLSQAIEDEDYMKAAKLRDEIKNSQK